MRAGISLTLPLLEKQIKGRGGEREREKKNSGGGFGGGSLRQLAWPMMAVVLVVFRSYPWWLMTLVVETVCGGSGSEMPVTFDYGGGCGGNGSEFSVAVDDGGG
ncbi:hypothetical protein Acr_26g0008840 [Actinidia rufa]|uniref:Uncharacterized protein n=1 Tax=Actinidia rufa TaxID=165716 RepID=A0A7J0H4C9_9ERIC|nr:hypothetical protein Acr_26g0008840 [Actinidia rufa]